MSLFDRDQSALDGLVALRLHQLGIPAQDERERTQGR